MKFWHPLQKQSRSEKNKYNLAYFKTLHGRLSWKASSINTSALNRGAKKKLNKDSLLRIWKNQGGKEYNKTIKEEATCAICRNPLDIFEEYGFIIDHVVPLNNGGENEESNIQLLCYMCHKKKSRLETRATTGKHLKEETNKKHSQIKLL